MIYASVRKTIPLIIIGVCVFVAVPLYAQTLFSEEEGIYHARVVEAGAVTKEIVEGTRATHILQPIRVEFTEGPKIGEVVAIENEFTPVRTGDGVYIQYFEDIDGIEYLYLFEIERSSSIWFLVGLFSVVLIIFGGMQGVRALGALALGLVAIVYVLVPGLLAGYPPVLVSVCVASAVLFLALVITHGFNRGSLVAFLGTTSAVIITGFLALFAIDFVHLSGIPSETEWYLSLNSGGSIDLLGLLLGGIIIGVLGALDDIAITQVATVRELYLANSHFSVRDVYVRAMRVGKAHVGSLVNTLALAYTGAALPLILLFSNNGSSTVPFVNLEIFATEIVRILVSSIGLVLTVPITTMLAAYFLKDHASDVPEHLHACKH